MMNKDNKIDAVDNEYKELIKKIKKELPNIVLPSMGMFDDSEWVDINGKDFVMSNKEV